MKRDAYLLYLDRYHQGDPLFLDALARALGQSGAPPCLLVHGSGEKVERTLESQGYFPEREGGVLRVETPEQKRLVERAVREANQELVGTLTDAVVSAVGVQGTDRGLLRRAESGQVQAGRVGWVEDLVRMRVVPVVSALARDGDGAVWEVATAEAAVVLARALEDFAVTVIFFTRSDRAGRGEASAEAAAEALAAPEAMHRILEGKLPVLLTDIDGWQAEGGPQGTWIGG